MVCSGLSKVQANLGPFWVVRVSLGPEGGHRGGA